MDNFRTIQELARDFEQSEKVIRSKVKRLVAGGHLTDGVDFQRNPNTGQYRIDPVRFYEGAREKLGVWLRLPDSYAVSRAPTQSVSEKPSDSHQGTPSSTQSETGAPVASHSDTSSGSEGYPATDNNLQQQLRTRDQEEIGRLRNRVHHLENKLEEKDKNHTETLGFLTSAHRTIDRLMLLASGRSKAEEGSETPTECAHAF